MSESEEAPINPKLALGMGIAAVSTASILIRLSSSHPFVIAGYRMAFSSVMMGLLSLRSLGELRRLSSRELWTLLVSGVALALHFGSWTTSLFYTSVAASTVIVDSSPIFVVLISWAFLKEGTNVRELMGIATALLGAFIISLGHSSLELNLLGDFLAFIGSISLAIYLVAGRRLRRKLGLGPYTTFVYGFSGLLLLATAHLWGVRLIGYPLREYAIFLVLALFPTGLGHNSYNYALKYLKTSIVSVSILGEPIGASILAALILGELPKLSTVLGGAITLLGIYLTVSQQE